MNRYQHVVKNYYSTQKRVSDTQEFKRNFEKHLHLFAGIDQEEIDTVTATVERVDNGLLELDTTIAGSVVLDADFFQRSDDVDNNASKWSGRNTPDEHLLMFHL